jgi:AraC-like DNA-binding protein
MTTMAALPSTLAFTYVQADFEQWAEDFATTSNVTAQGTSVAYPSNLGNGYTKGRIIEAGLSYRLANYDLNSELELTRNATNNFQLILYFYQMEFENGMYCKIDDEVFESTEKIYSISLLTSSLSQQKSIYKKGSKIRGVAVQMDETWLAANIANFEQLRSKLLNNRSYIMDFLTAKQRKIINDIFEGVQTAPLSELHITSRVLRLTEEYLTYLCNNRHSAKTPIANKKDFHLLVNVENMLLDNYAGQFPSIGTLAKAAFMSESKLKKLFKKAFGLAPYEYYQKNRMHKAKELLCSKNLSVTEVGSILGYQNLSNFSTAFKKEFNHLPSQVHEVA